LWFGRSLGCAGLDPAGSELYATDIDPAAVQCARRNLVDVHPPASVLRKATSMTHCQRRCWSVDVLLANAPYVPTESIALMPPEARIYEPRMRLDGGADGLDVHRRIAAGAKRWLAPEGHAMVETSRSQAAGT
jgi:release factor glutamine methyltransferase